MIFMLMRPQFMQNFYKSFPISSIELDRIWEKTDDLFFYYTVDDTSTLNNMFKFIMILIT